MNHRKLTGLAVCGGLSSRMGTDKSRLVYHQQPQCYHVYEMLQPVCDEVYLSVNRDQAQSLLPGYKSLTDDEAYAGIGPMAALMTAMDAVVDSDFLLLGCDYPLLDAGALKLFLDALDKTAIATAFYNPAAQVYEPLLAYYQGTAINTLKEMIARGQHSLQHFLKKNEAGKYLPPDIACIKSIDTESEARVLMLYLEKNRSTP